MKECSFVVYQYNDQSLVHSLVEVEAHPNRIVMNPNAARSFAYKGDRKLRKRGWVGELWSNKDLNEECYVEAEGCQMEEVMEYYGDNTDGAVSIKIFNFPSVCLPL